MFFHANNGGNRWNQHLNHLNVQLMNSGMNTSTRDKMCNYERCKQWQWQVNPNSLRHGNKKTMHLKIIACNSASLTN
jgi:hypothetical protein